MMEPGFDHVLEEALNLHERKHQDYNGKNAPWKEFGMMGRFFDINRKFQRLKTLIYENRTAAVETETVRDTLMDLLVYSVMAILLLDEEKHVEALSKDFAESFPAGSHHDDGKV